MKPLPHWHAGVAQQTSSRHDAHLQQPGKHEKWECVTTTALACWRHEHTRVLWSVQHASLRHNADLQQRLGVLQEPGCDGVPCLMERHGSALNGADHLRRGLYIRTGKSVISDAMADVGWCHGALRTLAMTTYICTSHDKAFASSIEPSEECYRSLQQVSVRDAWSTGALLRYLLPEGPHVLHIHHTPHLQQVTSTKSTPFQTMRS